MLTVAIGKLRLTKWTWIRRRSLRAANCIEMKNCHLGLKLFCNELESGGITLAPREYQHAMVYFQNVVSFSKSPEEHHRHIESVLQLEQMSDRTWTLKKHFVFPKTIDYHGRFEHNRTTSHCNKIEWRCTQLKILGDTTTSKLRFFSGLCAFHWFVLNFVLAAAPLHEIKLTHTTKKWAVFYNKK